MKVNLLFFLIFSFLGIFMILLYILFKLKDKNMIRDCNIKVKGKVIKFTIWHNNGVHFPIVQYIVNGIIYTQHLKYGWIITKTSSFSNIKDVVISNINENNLVINGNSHIRSNVLNDYFPIGTELDVYYDSNNPKKSYVMRFVKNPCSKLFFLLGLLFIIISIVGFIVIPDNLM